MKFILAAASAFAGLLLASAAVAQSDDDSNDVGTVYTGPGSYSQIGGTTFGPESTQTTIGQSTFVNSQNEDGSQSTTTYTRIGQTTFGSDGTTYNQIGGTTFGSDGSTSQTIGDTTFINGPNGEQHTCNQIGASTFCN